MEETKVMVVVVRESFLNYHFLLYVNVCQLRNV
jgi:hypothetical protein